MGGGGEPRSIKQKVQDHQELDCYRERKKNESLIVHTVEIWNVPISASSIILNTKLLV